jgi:hypothetical protein
MTRSPTIDALYRIKRGLAGYVSYLAACDMNQSFSEYVLYEPTLRILTAQQFTVHCEVPCPGYDKKGRGDFKKLDFVVEGNGAKFAIEIKWARRTALRAEQDIQKLERFLESDSGARSFLCVFGTRSNIESLDPITHVGR